MVFVLQVSHQNLDLDTPGQIWKGRGSLGSKWQSLLFKGGL